MVRAAAASTQPTAPCREVAGIAPPDWVVCLKGEMITSPPRMRELCSLDNDRGYLLLPQELLDGTFGLRVSREQVFGKGLGYFVTFYPSADKTRSRSSHKMVHNIAAGAIQIQSDAH